MTIMRIQLSSTSSFYYMGMLCLAIAGCAGQREMAKERARAGSDQTMGTFFVQNELVSTKPNWMQPCTAQEHIKSYALDYTGSFAIDFECSKCGQTVTYNCIITHIKSVIFQEGAAKSSASQSAAADHSVSQEDAIAMKSIDRIIEVASIDFLLFSLNLSISELEAFLAYYNRNSATGKNTLMMNEKIRSVLGNWDYSVSYSVYKIKELDRNRRRAFLFHQAFLDQNLCNGEGIESYICNIINICTLESPISPMLKCYFHARVILGLEFFDGIIRKRVIRFLYDSMEAVADVRNAPAMHIIKKIKRWGIDDEALELLIINSIFNAGAESEQYLDDICRYYIHLSSRCIVFALGRLIAKINKIIGTEMSVYLKRSIHRFCWIVDVIMQYCILERPSFIDVAKLFLLVKNNPNLGLLLAKIEDYLKRELCSIDILNAIYETSAADLENRESICAYVFTFSSNLYGNHPVCIFYDAINCTHDLILKLTIPYGLIFRGILTPAHTNDIISNFVHFQNSYYCDYMRGLAIYILRMLDVIPFSELIAYILAYKTSFSAFYRFLERSAVKFQHSISECTLYGLNLYLCNVLESRMPISHVCQYPYVANDESYGNIISGIAKFIEDSRGTWVAGYIENSLVCVLSQEISQDLGYTKNLYRALRVTNFAVKHMLRRGIPLLDIYVKYLGSKAVFGPVLIFNYFKELCYTWFGRRVVWVTFETQDALDKEKERLAGIVNMYLDDFRKEILRDVAMLRSKKQFRRAVMGIVVRLEPVNFNLALDIFNVNLRNKLTCELRTLFKAYIEWRDDKMTVVQPTEKDYMPTEKDCIEAFQQLFPLDMAKDRELLLKISHI